MTLKLEQNVQNHIVKDTIKMIIPIRCFSCGKPIGHLWEEYNKRIEAGEDRREILNDLGLDRYCCRALMMGHVDLLEEVAKFKKF
jgi:DNA-directed RNA polymerase subunit N